LPGLPPSVPRVSFPPEPYLEAIAHSGRDRHVHGMDAFLFPSPLALSARVAHQPPHHHGTDRTPPCYESARDALMHPPDLSHSTASRTLHLRRSRLPTLTLTAGAVGRAQDVNPFLGSKGCFLEGKLDLVVQVGSRLWRTSPGLGSAGEEGVEDVLPSRRNHQSPRSPAPSPCGQSDHNGPVSGHRSTPDRLR